MYIGIMPAELNIEVTTTHEYRRIDVFSAPVLHVNVTASGRFDPVDMKSIRRQFGRTLPNYAVLQLRVADVRGAGNVQATFNESELTVEPGSGNYRPTFNGSLENVDFLDGGEFTFVADLRSTRGLTLVPVGDEATVNVSSTWPHPKFSSRLLPDERDVRDDGFDATWRSNKLSRGFGSIVMLDQSAFGMAFAETALMQTTDIAVPEPDFAVNEAVAEPALAVESALPEMATHYNPTNQIGFEVFDPVTPYRAVVRSVKYGVLFIALTLAAFLCIELVTVTQFHYVQYLVVGVALIIFFLVLLSVAEKIGFDLGYVAGSALMTAMLCTYTFFSSMSAKITGAIFGLLVLLYAVLYTILKLDQHSMLLGTGLLVLMLGIMMWATKSLTATKVEKDETSAESTVS